MIERKIYLKLVDGLKSFRIVLLNGPRQSGKTTLVKQIAKDLGISYLTLDDPDMLALASNDPKAFLAFYADKPVAIDEIQFAPELIPFIKVRVDDKKDKGQFLLTGSADFMKMHHMTESLAGRMVRYNLFPLASSEIKKKKVNIIDALFKKDFAKLRNDASFSDVLDVILKGGYPEVQHLAKEQKDLWFSSYIASRIQKDILEYKRISTSKLREIKSLLQLLSANNAEILNCNKLSKKLQITNKTVLSYVELLESMYIVKTIPSYHVNASLRVIKSPKVHFIDSGLASHLLNIDQESLFLKKDSDYGSTIENFVFSELFKQSTYSKTATEIYHFRDMRKKEVDFVLEQKNGKIIGIEVKAKTSIKTIDLRPMLELAREAKQNFYAGFVFYGGDEIRPISIEGQIFYCLPLGLLA